MLQNQRTPDKNTQKNYGMSAQNFRNLSETIEKTADITKEQLAFLLATAEKTEKVNRSCGKSGI